MQRERPKLDTATEWDVTPRPNTLAEGEATYVVLCECGETLRATFASNQTIRCLRCRACGRVHGDLETPEMDYDPPPPSKKRKRKSKWRIPNDRDAYDAQTSNDSASGGSYTASFFLAIVVVYIAIWLIRGNPPGLRDAIGASLIAGLLVAPVIRVILNSLGSR